MGRRRPLDPKYGQQWHLSNDGSGGGKLGADIGAEAAWTNSRGAGVRIAVIDESFDVKHPDLKAAVGAGSGYFREQDGGDADFVPGLKRFPKDTDGHGTFCAGMAAARANNNKGGCGVAYEAELMLVACLPDAVGTQATLARALAYAADPSIENLGATSAEGAWVLACSLGPNDGVWRLESVLKNALDFAINKGRHTLGVKGRHTLGVPMFWAVGNDNRTLKDDEVCCHAATIAVGRSNFKDRADGSAYGPDLDFLAPGAWVYSTTSLTPRYDFATGTSFAAPCAAGIAALVLHLQPSLRWDEVRQIMRDSCEKIGDPKAYAAKGTRRHLRLWSGDAAKAVAQSQRAPGRSRAAVRTSPARRPTRMGRVGLLAAGR